MSFRSLVSILFAAGLTGSVSTPAAAQTGESGYAVLGKWTVSAVRDAKDAVVSCAATTNNGKADFRIDTNGRAWRVGTAYYGNKRKLEAYFGFGAAAEVAQLNAPGDGWAWMSIGADQLGAFRQSPSFAINVGDAEQTWDLKGAGAAIDKAGECVRNRGVPGQTVAAPAPAPAKAAGNNCPAPGTARSQNSNRALTVTFFNASKTPLDIVWIGYDGSWKKYQTVGPNKVVKQKTYATHPWIAVDPKGNCHGGVMIPDPNFKGETPEEQFQIWD